MQQKMSKMYTISLIIMATLTVTETFLTQKLIEDEFEKWQVGFEKFHLKSCLIFEMSSNIPLESLNLALIALEYPFTLCSIISL